MGDGGGGIDTATGIGVGTGGGGVETAMGVDVGIRGGGVETATGFGIETATGMETGRTVGTAMGVGVGMGVDFALGGTGRLGDRISPVRAFGGGSGAPEVVVNELGVGGSDAPGAPTIVGLGGGKGGAERALVLDLRGGGVSEPVLRRGGAPMSNPVRALGGGRGGTPDSRPLRALGGGTVGTEADFLGMSKGGATGMDTGGGAGGLEGRSTSRREPVGRLAGVPAGVGGRPGAGRTPLLVVGTGSVSRFGE